MAAPEEYKLDAVKATQVASDDIDKAFRSSTIGKDKSRHPS